MGIIGGEDSTPIRVLAYSKVLEKDRHGICGFHVGLY